MVKVKNFKTDFTYLIIILLILISCTKQEQIKEGEQLQQFLLGDWESRDTSLHTMTRFRFNSNKTLEFTQYRYGEKDDTPDTIIKYNIKNDVIETALYPEGLKVIILNNDSISFTPKLAKHRVDIEVIYLMDFYRKKK